MNIAQKALGFILFSSVMFASGAWWMNIRDTKHYEPLLAASNAALDAINYKTKYDKLDQEKVNAKLKTDYDKQYRILNDYAISLQNNGKGNNLPDPATIGKQESAPNPERTVATGQSTISGCSAKVELDYIEDLINLNYLRDFILTHKFPLDF